MWFYHIYLSHYLTIKVAPFQVELFQMAMEPKLMVIMPRGYGKSIIWSVGYPLWVVLNNPYNLDLKWNKEDLFMISNTSNLAEKWIRTHKKELLYNERIQADYEVTPGELWRNDQIDINVRGVAHGGIIARGSGAQIRGEHPTEVVIDDLENRSEAKSETSRENMREYFYQDLWGALREEENKQTRIKMVGTNVHPLGLLPELYGKDWWPAKRQYAVYNKDGSPLWPEYMDETKLQEKRMQVPETAWASEYLNQPIVSENPTFRREQFKPYEPGMIRGADGKKIATKDMLVVTALDPAISQRDGSDYSAISTWGATWDEDKPGVYCLDARRGHWSLSVQITELLNSYERFPGSVQIIETVAYQKALYYAYKERLERDFLNIRVIEVIPNKDKGMRANAVTPLFEQGLVHFDFNDKMQEMLMNEMALFDYATRKSGTDDWVDSAVYALTHISEWFRRRKVKGRGKAKPTIIRSGGDAQIHRAVVNG